MRNVLILVAIMLTVSSCNLFSEDKKGVRVARVNDAYLYKQDIEALVNDDISREDSVLVVNGYINRWATRQLLMDGARRNISKKEQARLESLVEQYRTDLYSQAYKNALVEEKLDSVIDDKSAQQFYESNKSNFKLNEELYRLRFLYLNEADYDVETIKERFIRYNDADKKYLDSIAVQFKAQSLDDSLWVDKKQVLEAIGPINLENQDELLKKTRFLQLRDSLGLYLITINDKLERNDEAPLNYVLPTVKQIMLNKNKLELIKQLETDITKDAIKNKQFEIYN